MFHKRPVVSIHLVNCKFSDWIPIDTLIQLTGYKELWSAFWKIPVRDPWDFCYIVTFIKHISSLPVNSFIVVLVAVLLNY